MARLRLRLRLRRYNCIPSSFKLAECASRVAKSNKWQKNGITVVAFVMCVARDAPSVFATEKKPSRCDASAKGNKLPFEGPEVNMSSSSRSASVRKELST